MKANKHPEPGLGEANPPTLRRIFGDSAVARLLDYLTLYRGIDSSKTEISKNSGVAWKTMWRIWPILESYDLVRETKRIGRARMFTLNADSPVVKALNDLAFQIAKHDNQAILKRENQVLVKIPAR